MCFGCVQPAVSENTSKRILVLDCDDTLYRNHGKTDEVIRNNIDAYVTEKLKLDVNKVRGLYKKYGTTIRGLLKEGLIEEEQVDDFLEAIHTFPNEGRDLIKNDAKLRNFLNKVTVEKFIFTASISSHAARCCRALGVEDLLISDSRPIIDARSTKLQSKYDTESFEICLREINEFLNLQVDPVDIVFVDDNLKNVQCAKKIGWGVCILMGVRDKSERERPTPLEDVDYVVEHLSELADIMELQDLFIPKNADQPRSISL